MMMLIAAALAAAPPAVPADPNGQHGAMVQTGDMNAGQHGHMADMKDCCCKEMMARIHEGHHAGHEGHPAE
jgi:hypothetical protein